MGDPPRDRGEQFELGQLSEDRASYWDGAKWQSTISPDGNYRWDGQRWAPTSAPAVPAPGPSRPSGKSTCRTFFPLAAKAEVDDVEISVKFGNRQLNVPTRLAEAATVSSVGGMTSWEANLQIIGAGAVLGNITLRRNMAAKFQRFINAEIANRRHQ